jgi:molybdopterin/thiamine biosynthesis adenylyltransferase
MPHTPHDFLDEARRAIPEVSVEAVAARRTHGDEVVLLDVRETDEVRDGYIEDAITIPRGLLEFQAAAHLPQTDMDVVDRSNLQRQVLHTTDRVGMPKTASAALAIHALNPDVQVCVYPERLTVDNVLALFQDYDVIVDGSDNFPTRYLVNDAAVLVGKPVVHGSIFQFEGQASVFTPYEGPCYRCLYPTPPPPGLVPSCSEVGVLGVLPGVIGVIQATETIKLLIGQGEPLVGRLLMYDALAMRFREIRIRRDPDCPLCGAHPTITELLDYEEFCGLDTAALTTIGA